MLGGSQGQLNRDYFNPDLELIRALSDCTSLSEIRPELSDHRYHDPVSGARRCFLGLRFFGPTPGGFCAEVRPKRLIDGWRAIAPDREGYDMLRRRNH